MGRLADDTAVVGRDGCYRATLRDDWEIWGPFGGYVAAVALRASAMPVPPELLPASFTCQFLSRAEFDAVDVDVEVRRASRRTALVEVRLAQAGTPVLDAQAWFAATADVVFHDHVPPHRYGHPDDHPDLSAYTTEPSAFAFWRNFERKPLDWVDDWERYPGGFPEWAEWLRLVPEATSPDPVVEACRLLLLADLPSFPAAVRAHPDPERGWVSPSLDLAVQFHGPAPLGDWLLVHGTAPLAERGLMAFRSSVWTADGHLAASGSGQLLCRSVPPGAPGG